MAIADGRLELFGNSAIPPQTSLDGVRLLKRFEDVVRNGETISIEVSSQRLGLNYSGGIEVVDSPYLYNFGYASSAFNLYAAFNRTISGADSGSGVSKVVVTIYLAR